MKNFAFVFIGSGLGGCIRYGLTVLLSKYNYTLPIHTLSANVLACLVLGMTISFLLKNPEHSGLNFLIAIGICGGMSTYSTFSYELMQQINAGAWAQVILYSLASFVLCLAAIMVGTRV